MSRIFMVVVIFFALIVTCIFTSVPSAAVSSYEKLLQEVKSLKVRFQPLPEMAENSNNRLTPAKIKLGKTLFMDTRLSKNHDVSCNSCHNLKTFGVDHQVTSSGHRGQLGGRNSPTVYNAALHFRQFWDGRAKDVEEQVLRTILNPIEMAMPSEEYVLEVLKSIPEYRNFFRKAFPGEMNPLNYKNVGKAIGAFERTLLTPSRFDEFLNGDDNALTEEELEGLNTFATMGCTTCHQGVAIGALSFQKLGLIKKFKTKDLGRFEVTKAEADRFYFKPPSLRNVAKTAPYFHDGSVETLEKAVKLMAKHQLGVKIKKNQIRSIVAFLNSLTGKIPEEALTEVQLPPSSSTTPEPDPS